VSVLIEAMSLVVPRILLDDRYPGGADAYLRYLNRPSSEARYAIADPHLVCASYFDIHAAERATEPLLDNGFVELDDETFHDFAIVEQQAGPTRACLWLMWTHDSAGITLAWFSGASAGELVTPSDWVPAIPSRLKHTDIRDIPGRALCLSLDNEIETWLDFDTGRVLTKSSRGRKGHAG
jgi:hypothetical protein